MPFHARHVHRLIHVSKAFTSRVCWKEYCFVYEPTRSTFVNIRYNSRFIFLMRNRKVVYLLFSGQYRQVFRLVKILYQIVIGHRLASWTFSHSTDTVVYARCLNKANLSWPYQIKMWPRNDIFALKLMWTAALVRKNDRKYSSCLFFVCLPCLSVIADRPYGIFSVIFSEHG